MGTGAQAEAWWREVRNTGELRQGDLLPDCPIPLTSFPSADEPQVAEVDIGLIQCVILTQGCDLANDPPPRSVAMCPVYSIDVFEDTNPDFARSGKWDAALRGRIEGIHVLAPAGTIAAGRNHLVVDFREIYSLPFSVLRPHAERLVTRWRLQSPYLEHLSQALARFFMRVGLPDSLPRVDRRTP